MKRITLLCLLGSICFLLASCGTMEPTTDNLETEITITESPIIEPTAEPEPTISPSPAIETDHFIGEYTDPETNQPGLQIHKDEDGYWVKIDVLGNYHVPCSLCELVDGKLKFVVAKRADFMKGTVTEKNGIATVTFLKDCWDVVHAGDTFTYQKTSDIPYERYNELIKTSPSPSPAKPEDYVGEYFEWNVNSPDLEIQRNEDGTFQVEFIISRIFISDPCVGKFVDDRIEFTFEDDMRNLTMKAVVSLEKDEAILTMLSDDWKNIDDSDTYYFYKVSDIPYDYINRMKESEESEE